MPKPKFDSQDPGNYLELQGFIHQLALAPAGDPWPFVLMAEDGHGSTSCQIHEDDADALIAFLQSHKTRGG